MADIPLRDGSDQTPQMEAWGAIAAFEGILEVMPNDCSALDALIQSYEMVGDRDHARQYLIRLARVHVEQSHLTEAIALTDRLRASDDGDPEIGLLLQEIEGLRAVMPDEPLPIQPAAATATAATDRQSALQAELSLAWRLHEKKMLSPDEYAMVVQDLTEVSSRPSDLTVSVLHVLQDRSFRNLDQVMAFIARDARVALIPASSFDPQEAAFRLLPMEFIQRRGAIPFEILGTDVLIAVLDPYDDALREDVRKATGRPCHFFLTSPVEFDAWINKVRDLLRAAG